MNKFKIFNSEWKIKYVDKIEGDEEDTFQLGNTNPVTGTITIAKEAGGVKLTKDQIKLTLLHELLHAVFQTGQYRAANVDEPLIEWTANCILSLIKQKVI